MNETKYWVWLSMVFGVSSRRIWEAMSLFSSAKEAYTALVSDTPYIKLNDKEKLSVSNTDIMAAERLIAACGDNGIGVACYRDSLYPPQLRHIADPPAVLYYMGNISCLTGTRTVTVVGTRHASEYGLRAARTICGELARSGLIIVSGFALGTDITAQLAAADAGRPTACVLGCGTDVDYPRENVQHRGHILETGGVILSEYPPGTPARPAHFPVRNRILAALGKVTVVFEASSKSGSLITANLAADQGRELFCLPPYDIMSENCSGNVLLMRHGANPLLSSMDVVDCFRIGSSNDRERRRELMEKSAGALFTPSEEHIRKLREKALGRMNVTRGAADIVPEPKPARAAKAKADRSAAKAEKDSLQPDISQLEGVHRRIAEILMKGPAHADSVAQELGEEASELMAYLTEMEIDGVIRSLPGKMFEICR